MATRTKKVKGGSKARTGSPARKTKHVDSHVAARNNALTAMGGVKVDVFVRVRPQLTMEKDQKVVVSADTSNQEIMLEGPDGHPAKYTYDKAYGPEVNQKDIYEDCVAPIIEQVCRGMSCAIFAYGQTGTGKTYTMRGDLSDDPNHLGIIQRSVNQLFQRLQEFEEYEDVTVKCSFLEIYMEELEDLFVDPPKTTGKDPRAKVKNNLRLVDDTQLGCRCDGLAEIPVANLAEVMELLMAAEKRCKFSETKMNKLSNRAHRIFTFIVNFKRYDKPVLSTLTFVDLAGSEDIAKSGAKGLTAREASYINKSLLTLGRVINALACNEKHIPYRDSKLTRLLSEALGGVCKTSFIACVSPCSGSGTESNATLRYAERAMEALNISQLPRHKQDEIMIDGLTRRVQLLVDEMTQKDRIHKEIVNELKSEKKKLLTEAIALRKEMASTRRKMERVGARKDQLKKALSHMTDERDLLHSQKEALQAELLETRRVRDGYLQDRDALEVVMASTRGMREKLLKAHGETETSLHKDTSALKKTIEGAVADITELHAEVQRKKGLSVHNEKLADKFRGEMQGRVKTMTTAVQGFKAAQQKDHGALSKMLAALKVGRKRDHDQLVADLEAFAAETTEAFSGITAHAREVEGQHAARIEENRATADAHHEATAAAVEKMSQAVAAQLEQLRGFAAKLGESNQGWTDKMKAKFDETLASASTFTTDLGAHAAAMQAHLEGATTAQLMHLKEHREALEANLEAEKRNVAVESDQLVTDISAFVKKMVAEYAHRNVDRCTKATDGFSAAVDALSTETDEMVAHQNAEHAKLEEDTAAWSASIGACIDDGQKNNTASFFTSTGLLKKTVGASEDTDKKAEAGAKAIAGLDSAHHAAMGTELDSQIAFVQEAAQACEVRASEATDEVQADCTRMADQAQNQQDKFKKDTDAMKGSLKATAEAVATHADAQDTSLGEVQGATDSYVKEDLRRDTQPEPAEKEYKYPQKYKKTSAYEKILSSTADEWAREDAIRTGELQPGKGPDFPGDVGEPDMSGLLTTTQDKERPDTIVALFDDAARQSSAEDYEDDPRIDYDQDGDAEFAADDSEREDPPTDDDFSRQSTANSVEGAALPTKSSVPKLSSPLASSSGAATPPAALKKKKTTKATSTKKKRPVKA